jgi:two-component system cell cycle sensor histidine kinase/response regulator CckA
MAKRPKISDPPGKLRGRAEASLRDRRNGKPAQTQDHQTAEDTLRQLHELEVHKIELEMQNAELQQARTQLESSLEKFTELYDFAPMGYLTLDPQLVIREINLAGALLLGVDRSSLANRPFEPFVSAADQPALRAFLERVFASSVQHGCEVTLSLPDKAPLDVSLKAVAFESGQLCHLAMMDLTERRQAEADRLIMNKLESTGILAGGIAHDFNNLQTVVLLNIEMAQLLIPAGDKFKSLLEEAKQSALLTKGLTAQLITFADGGAPIRKPILLNGVIRKSVGLALSGSNVRCEVSLAKDLWMVEVDADQIGQVMRNLVLNARESMAQGGRIFVTAENVLLSDHEQPPLHAGEYVRVSIADQGTGIAKEMLSKIFDPYFSTKQRGPQKGMGLGLTICHTVVQRHNGAIRVESEMGLGTTFRVLLPASNKSIGETEKPVLESVSQHHKILLMDDEAGVRNAVALTLRRMGHQVELAENGQQAVELYGKAQRGDGPFGLVILDLIVRGGMGGLETIQALLRMDPAVKAVIMSGYANETVILEHDRHGFKGALTKPFYQRKLQQLLSQVMNTRETA